MAIPATQWSEVLDREYLAQFVPAGGAASKIAVAPVEFVTPETALSETSPRALMPLETAAIERGFVVARVSSRVTKVQMIDQIFFAVARQIDWDGLCQHWLRQQFAAQGFEVAPDQNLSDLDEIARANGLSKTDLMGALQRAIFNEILRDVRLDKEFRTAMAMLAQATLNPGNVSEADAEVIGRWLRGERFSLTALKRLQIWSKIARHNARRMLSSLALWLHINGHAGLVLSLDVASLWDDAPPDPAKPAPRYTRNAVLDFYEVLRQFIDETDTTEHFLLLVAASPGFWTHPKKSVDQYTALKMRVADEVRDATRANPLNAAVQIEVEG